MQEITAERGNLHQQPSPSPAASAAAAASSHTSQSLRTCLSRFEGSHQKYLRHSVYQMSTSDQRSGPPTPMVWRQATASTAKCCASPGRTDQSSRKSRKTSTTERQGARRAAYRFLKHSEDSTYAYQLQEHKKFLAKHAEEGATERQRLRPMRIIEEIGVDCAIWPDLHWTTDMCETYGREHDGRRLARIAKANGKRADDSADNEDFLEDSEPEKELRRDRPWQHARDASENATRLMCPRRDQEMS